MNVNFFLLHLLLISLFTACQQHEQPFDNRDFSLDVQYKTAGDTVFVSNTLQHDLKVKSGSGSPDNPYLLSVEVQNRTATPWKGIVSIDLVTNHTEGRFFLPGYMYGSNQGNAVYNPNLIKQFQRLRKGPVSIPYSPYWYMRSDQLTHPIATVYTGGTMFGISGSPYLTQDNPYTFWQPGKKGFETYNGFHCSIKEQATVGFTVGYQNAPGIYTSPWKYTAHDDELAGNIIIPAGSKIDIPVKVYAAPAQNASVFGEILKNTYQQYHEPPLSTANSHNVNQAIKKITKAISSDAYSPVHNTYGLISLKPYSSEKDNIFVLKDSFNTNNYDYKYEGLISWTNGSVIAVPLLQAAHYEQMPSLRGQAVSLIDDIVTNSLNPDNGIPYCTKIDGQWTNKGWWTEWVKSEQQSPVHSSYIVGQALHYILKAYDIEKSLSNNTNEDWLRFVKDVLTTISASQNEAGGFPRFWSENDVTGTEYDAFSGCWVAAAMAYYTLLTNDERFLSKSIQAQDHYQTHVENMECIKTPLDVADAPDSEGILSYIRLTKILHELTRDKQYLESMKTGIDYALSFSFCYNTPITSPPLNNLQWSTSGGAITSVCNAVIHCMTNTIIEELNYYQYQTGDAYYRSRMEDTYRWGLQVYNHYPQHFLFGNTGWSTEYFCQAERYVLDIRLENGKRSNIWFAYHPWATSSILEGIYGYSKTFK